MKKVISLLLALTLVLSMTSMAFADLDGRRNFSVIVTADKSLEFGDSETVYCQIFGVDYDDPYFIGISIDWYTTDRNVIQMPKSYLTQADTEITVKAVGEGTAKVCAQVTANYMDGRQYIDYGYTEITVIDDRGIEVSPWTKSLSAGESFTLSVSGVGFGGSAYFWSDNPKVAKVDDYGRVTAVGSGTTNIWAEWAGYSDCCSVNVKGEELTITALTPTSQSRSVNAGTSQKDLKNNFDSVYGYYLNSKGNYNLVECPVSWYSYDYNSSRAGSYTFYGTVSAPDGYKLAKNLDDIVIASVKVVQGYNISASFDYNNLEVGDTTTLTVRLTDNKGNGISTINGSKVQIALNYANGCITLDKKYVALDSKGYGYVTVNAKYSGNESLTAVAWANGSEVCGTGIYFTVAAPSARLPFTDVAKSAWYYDDLSAVYKMGLISGKSVTKYDPSANMTYAEAIKIAACMNQYYYTGKVTLKNGAVNWYDTYVAYAKANGIPYNYANMNAKITRSDYIHIFFNALPISAFSQINNIKAVPDMAPNAAHYDEILALYKAGVLTGDAKGYFNPTSYINRAEVVAIINRMMNESARKLLVL